MRGTKYLKEREAWGIAERKKSDQETCRDSNQGPFAYRVNALLTKVHVMVRGEWSLNPTKSSGTFTVANTSPLTAHTPCTIWLFSHISRGPTTVRANRNFYKWEALNIWTKEKHEVLPNGKSDQETCRDSNRGPFAYRANALPNELQVTVRGEWLSEF